jgi:hypothetical protein
VVGVVFEYNALEEKGDDADHEDTMGDDVASVGHKANEPGSNGKVVV